MCARMGVVTGKGLSDLIREEFGLRITFSCMVAAARRRTSATSSPSSPASPAAWSSSASRNTSRVPICAFVVWVARRQGQLQERREDLPHRLRLLHCLHHRRRARAARLEARRSSKQHASAAQVWSSKSVRLHDRRRHRHDDRALDAVLPPVLHRRKRRHGRAVQGSRARRHRRLHLHRRRRLVHHRRLRRHALHPRHAQHRRRHPTPLSA